MIKRLALLIHWFGFLAGFIASLFFVTVVILQDTPPNIGIYEVLLVAFVAVTIQGVWIRKYGAFFVAGTPDGDVYLSPPDKQGITSGFGPGIKNTGARNPAENVQLTKRVCFQIDALKDDFIECRREAMAKNGY